MTLRATPSPRRLPRSLSHARAAALLLTLGALAPLGHPASADDTPALARLIDGAQLRADIETLASDDFEGRAPGGTGEERTIRFLIEQFKAYGLKPGNPDGSYLQAVPMSGFRPSPVPTLSLNVAGSTQVLSFPTQFVAASYTGQPLTTVKDSELVFVGYGVKAPEFGWDDYKGVDLRGKTLVMLINDPPVPDPVHPGQLDPAVFGGKAMTYYGRWTYKYEIAAKLGAAAALIIHETEPAAYPFSVLRDGYNQETFSLRSDQSNPDFPPVSAWIENTAAEAFLKATGHSYAQLKQLALSRDFRPLPLKASADFTVHNVLRAVDSHNVVARIEGSDPKLRAETVIYSAHWDHLGWNPALPGDKHAQIYHGALDNASGVAALLAIARTFAAPGNAPKRSVLFVVTTGEEQGLLGARYYAAHPLYPLKTTLADLNIDEITPFGRARDVPVIGSGKSTLEDAAARIAATEGRHTVPDPHPEYGEFYRGDQLEFARVGVPVLYLAIPTDLVGAPAGTGHARFEDFVSHDYHQVTDTVKPDWRMDGMVEDIELLYRVGAELAAGAPYPTWKPGAEFKAIREQSLGAR